MAINTKRFYQKQFRYKRDSFIRSKLDIVTSRCDSTPFYGKWFRENFSPTELKLVAASYIRSWKFFQSEFRDGCSLNKLRCLHPMIDAFFNTELESFVSTASQFLLNGNGLWSVKGLVNHMDDRQKQIIVRNLYKSNPARFEEFAKTFSFLGKDNFQRLQIMKDS